MYRVGKMANRKEHHDMTDRQRQRDIMPGTGEMAQETKPENSNNLPDGFNFEWL